MNTIDPHAESGFIRIPRSYLTLPVSPGAKVLLMHLCASANERGESWHAYENIALLIGRSKASVSAYVRELTDLGLVEAIEQKMANGFNYRRRLRLTQWSAFLTKWQEMSLTKKSRQSKEKASTTEAVKAEFSVTRDTPVFSDRQAERRIRQAERKDPSGPNYIQKNKTPSASAPAVVWTDYDEAEWRRFRPSDRDPVSVGTGLPSQYLIRKMQQIEADLSKQGAILTPDDAKTAALSRLTTFAHSHRIIMDQEALNKAAQSLAGIADTEAAQDACMETLEALWQPHWRKMPTPHQIKDSLTPTAQAQGTPAELRIRISQIRTRLWVARMHMSRQSGAINDAFTASTKAASGDSIPAAFARSPCSHSAISPSRVGA